MNVLYLTIPAFLLFCAGSYCTYTKEIRDSWYFTYLIVFMSLFSAWIWSIAAKNSGTTSNLLFFSLIWDVLMVVAYYAGPLIFKNEGFGWQVYASAALTVTGICWFKFATEQ